MLVNDLPPGPGSGVEVHLDRLVRGLRAAGDDVELFAGEVVHRGAARALDVWDPMARRKLAARVEAFRPDVVHHHHVVRELSSAVLGVGEVPQVLTVHDFRLLGDTDAASGLLGWAKRAKGSLDRRVAQRRIDLVVAVSVPLADALTEAGFSPVVHVPPFGDLPADKPPPPSACLDVSFAGRLAEDKGLGVLAEAWPHVLAVHPWTQLCVAGAGPLALALAALDRTTQLGAVGPDQVRGMFERSRVVVVPSVPGLRAEGTPTVAIEAALCGRPLVVSDDPGLAAFAEASGGAIVVPGGNWSTLAEAVNQLLSDDCLADDLGARGLAYAREHHTTEAGVARLRELYAGLLER